MEDGSREIRWAPRVPQSKIRRLYQLDATGITDEELLDDVGWTLRARCQSLLEAEEASRGMAKCPRCDAAIAHGRDHGEVLRCDCGWQTTWGAYHKTFQHKQLSGPDLVPIFQEFVDRLPMADSPRDKMLLIDRLIHEFHWSLKTGPRRPSAVNLIEGRLHEVVEFLDQLTYGEASTPGTRETLREWRRGVNFAADAWGDESLRRDE